MTAVCCLTLQGKVEMNKERLAGFKKSNGIASDDPDAEANLSTEKKKELEGLERSLKAATDELRHHLRLSHGA